MKIILKYMLICEVLIYELENKAEHNHLNLDSFIAILQKF